jgi:hypothetical protein
LASSFVESTTSGTFAVNTILPTLLGTPRTVNTTERSTVHALSCVQNCTFSKIVSNYGKWWQCQTKATAVVGHVKYIVDNSTNTTLTSTSYAAHVTFKNNGTLVTSAVSDILANGSQILTRNDTNDAGTVTRSFLGGEVMFVLGTRTLKSQSLITQQRIPYNKSLDI